MYVGGLFSQGIPSLGGEKGGGDTANLPIPRLNGAWLRPPPPPRPLTCLSSGLSTVKYVFSYYVHVLHMQFYIYVLRRVSNFQ
jgi:hypothetical protein